MSGFTNSTGKVFSRSTIQERLAGGTCPDSEYNDTLFGMIAMMRHDGVPASECAARASEWTRQVRPEKVGKVKALVDRIYARALPFK